MNDSGTGDGVMILARLSADPMGFTDATLNPRWLNPAALRMAGFDLGCGPDGCTPEALAEIARRASSWPMPELVGSGRRRWFEIARTLTGRPLEPHAVRFARPDGAAAEFTCHAFAHDGGWVFVATPQISRAALDDRFREAESRYRSLIEHVPGAFYRCEADANWTMRFISDAIETISGYPARDFLENRVRTFTSIIHPEDVTEVERRIHEFVGRRLPFGLEYRLIHKDGAVRWVEETGAGVFDADGRLLHLDGFIRDISENRKTRDRLELSEAEATQARVRAEAALAELEAYRAALDHHAMVVVADGSGRILRTNGRFAARFGYDEAALVGRDFRVIDAGTRNDAGTAALIADVEARRISQAEFLVRASDGNTFWVNATVVPVIDSRTREPRQVGILEDITARKESELRVLEERQRLQLALEGGDLGLWDWNLRNGHVTYDARWAGMLGETLGDLVPDVTAWSGRVHEDDLERAQSLLNDCHDGRTDRYEWTGRMRHRDGSWRWILARGRVVERDEEGRPSRIVGTHADVSSRVAAELALNEQIEKLEAAERQTCMGHWAWNRVSGEITWSANLFVLHGRDPSLGMPDYAGMMSRFRPESQARLANAVKEAIETGRPYRVRLECAPPGVAWLECEAQAMTGSGGEVVGLVGTCIDVTERVESEKALTAAMARVEAATRAKSEFLANMSHEIRSPLTSILGYAEILRDELVSRGESTEGLKAADTILRAGGHLLTIINDILDISKIEAGRMTLDEVELGLVSAFADVHRLAEPRARDKGLTLTIEGETALPERVRGDPKRLRQILMNLVGNALKFTESGGIRVSARQEPEDDPSWLVIDVADTGIGIPREAARQLFQPFSQVDGSSSRQHEGTGLGLNICRRLADMMDGSVRLLWSEPGIGSCFRVELPLRAVSGTRLIRPGQAITGIGEAGDTPRPEPDGAPLSGHILIVDDSEANLTLFRFHFERAGARVTTAEDGRAALRTLAALEASGEHVQLVVTDIQMPEMDGYTLVKHLRDRGWEGPIVALTAHAMAEDRRRALDAGCDDYISKPVDRHALVARCRSWLGRLSHAR